MILLSLFCLFLLLLALLVVAMAVNRPPLFSPPGVTARLAVYLGSNVAETADDARFPELRPRRYPFAPALLLQTAEAAARALGFEQVRVEQASGRLSAVAVSRWLKFRDDIVLTVSAIDGGALLHARSASRVGRADLAANQHHLRRLFDEIGQRVHASTAK